MPRGVLGWLYSHPPAGEGFEFFNPPHPHHHRPHANDAHLKKIVQSVINIFWYSSIVIDSDRGHCYEHLKKKNFKMKIETVTCI